jgi:hypothetical protein
MVFNCLIVALGRNPSKEERLFKFAMLGFTLTEALWSTCTYDGSSYFILKPAETLSCYI